MAATVHDQRTGIVGSLRVTAAEAAGRSWSSASDDELLTALGDLQRLRNQIDALAGQIAVAAEGGATQRAGSRNAALWTGANTNASPARIRHDARLARWLLDYAEFRDAYSAGELTRHHIDALRAAERPVTRTALLSDSSSAVHQQLELDDSGATFGTLTVVNHRADSLTVSGRIRSTDVRVRLRLRPAPTLFSSGFHWVNEYPNSR